MRKMSTNCLKLKDSNHFFVLHQLLRKTLSPRDGDSSRFSQYERNILHAISEEERLNVLNFIFQEIWNVAIYNNRSCAYAPYIIKMIEKVSKKTFVKNIEHTKLRPNKQCTSINPGARTWIPPPNAASNYWGSGLALLKMLRGIFIACRASKEVIIKRQEGILRHQHIIHCKLEITEPLEEFDETEAELVDPYGSLTTEELAYFQMGEAVSSNAPHGNNNDKDDDDELDDGEEE
jgi:hypothetical protein